MQAAADLVWSPVLRKFPDLKIALSEGGIGWIPYFLERIDYTYSAQRAGPAGLRRQSTPTDFYRRNIGTCFIDDRVGVENRHRIGVDTICWELDYPHSDSTWPTRPSSSLATSRAALTRRSR